MKQDKINIRTCTLDEIKEHLKAMNEKPFRAKQIYEWLWKKGATSFDAMTNLSLTLRENLAEQFVLPAIQLKEAQVSKDGTIKCAFATYDGHAIEGVLIPTSSRMTACISSQAGCSLACKFCATGKLALRRNLTPGEIFDQVFALNEMAETNYGKKLSNIVYMGMGEPLLNYKSVLQSVDYISSEEGLGFSPKRITISTAGIAKMIKKLGDDEVRFNLALSLHAANDQKRSEIMAINDSNNLEVLADALKYFYEKTGTRVTYEYIIFKDFNDEIQDARELAEFGKNVPCKVNIIEYNPIDDGEFQQADQRKVDAFADFLSNLNMIVNVRRSRGKDIDAACGQLANKNKIQPSSV